MANNWYALIYDVFIDIEAFAIAKIKLNQEILIININLKVINNAARNEEKYEREGWQVTPVSRQ